MGSGVGFFLLPVLVGYMSLSTTVVYERIKTNGTRLFLASAVEGYLVSGLIYITVVQVLEWCLSWQVDFYSLRMFFISMSTVAFFIILNHSLSDRRKWVLKVQKQSALDSGDHLESILVDSIISNDYVKVVLKNREVLLGYPVHTKTRSSTDTSIPIIVVMKGYLSEDDLATNFKPDSDVRRAINLGRYFSNGDYGDKLRWVIQKSQIVHVEIVDKKIFDVMFEPRKIFE